MPSASPDAPRIIIFPPLIPIATAVAATLLQWLRPLGAFQTIDFLLRALIGVVLLVAGMRLVVRGNLALVRSGTHVHPARPALKLVTTGVYARTRNPIYVGGSCAMFAVAFLFGLDWLPVLFLLSFLVLHLGIVVPEEKYLERKFGYPYCRYRADVPRYFGAYMRFHLAMAILIFVVVAYGFSFTLDRRLLHADPSRSWIVWLHATVFFGWVGFFATQTVLISARRVGWHRRFGMIGLLFGALIPVLGVATAISSARLKSLAGADARAAAEAFLVIPMNDVICFTTAFAFAWALRRKPEFHRRLMFLASCCLTAAAFARMPMMTITALRWYGGVDALIAIGIARDLWVERRIHTAYLVAVGPLLALQTLTMATFIERPPPWMALAERLIGW